MRFEVRTLLRPRRRILALALGVSLISSSAQGTVFAIGPDLTAAVRAGPEALDVNAAIAPNFQEQTVISGLTQPTVVEFAADGRVFVAEKSGLIKVWDNLDDNSASTYADLRTNVHDYWDRGLLGMALDPDFTANGRMYVAYTYNAPIGQAAPFWPDADCPEPPGGATDGCVVSGRVSALTDGGAEQVLINDWCMQFPSHSMSDILIDAEGALIIGGGDGADFNKPEGDYGQWGGSPGSPTPRNPCGDPPGGVGGAMTLPSAEGGALRSQDVLTSTDPTGLAGSIIRIDRFSGAALPSNPRTTGNDNERRIVAHGLRNPFRMALHPVNGDLWIGDVGWNTWEEINRTDPDGASVTNFGWPCREGAMAQPAYAPATLCTSVGTGTSPIFTYQHLAPVTPADEDCNFTGGTSISGLAFYPGGPYPDEYDNALFFADYWRQCIWVMPQGAGGVPDPAQVARFATAATPVHLAIGPGGDLFYVNIGSGTVRRIVYLFDNSAPVAHMTASPAAGAPPLAVAFDATGSTDPDDDALTYAWSFGDDGAAFDDAFGPTPAHTYTDAGTYLARVRVADGRGGTDVASVIVDVGNTPPVATITGPPASFTWSVGQTITLTGTGTDAEEGNLPASAMRWEVAIAHCPDECHEHPLGVFLGVSTHQITAPDHEYPSYLIVRLRVEDEHGAIGTVEREIHPKTVSLRMRSEPIGPALTAGSRTSVAPFDVTSIAGSSVQIAAPSGALIDGFPYEFVAWSHGGPRVQTVRPTASTTYTAVYAGGFDDVPAGAAFRSDIAWLVRHGITAGCSATLYCPTAPVTREQMASFLVRTVGLTGSAPDAFTDDETSVHQADINRLAAAGITGGCTPTTFCPKQVVTREQMASFLARALELGGTAPDAFTDDETSIHEGDINRLAAAGITGGCTPTTFCPKAPVTRGQMAAFLHRGFVDLFGE